MYFDDFSGHYQPNSITIFIKFGVNVQIGTGTGVILAARRIGTGSGFDHARGTPLPISKASIPPPPEALLEQAVSRLRQASPFTLKIACGNHMTE